MVFCYKIVTESPRRSGSVSPVRRSPTRLPALSNSISQLIQSVDYEACGSDILDSIPEREWRLLAALARKRTEREERENLAEEFRRMWQKEKQEREMVQAESLEEYNRYVHGKRQKERERLEFRRLQSDVEQQLKKGLLMDCIRHKEQRSAEQLAWSNDKRAKELVSKMVEDQARLVLAADRRIRLEESEDWRRRVEMVEKLQRVDKARRQRDAYLRDASRRVAISNALSIWETNLVRQEVRAMEAVRRAEHAARAALTDARSTRLAHARNVRKARALRVAAVTERLRDAVRGART